MKSSLLFSLLLLIPLFGEAQTKQFQGQGSIRVVDTSPRPVAKQWRGIFALLDSSVFLRNDFQGGRLNGAIATSDSTIELLIAPENTPINPSPWYAFKVWAKEATNVAITLNYPDSVRHRYFPKVSRDGRQWTAFDSTKYREFEKGDALFGTGSLPLKITMHLEIDQDTLWIAAQELQTSKHVFAWLEKQAEKPFINPLEIGKSREDRPIRGIRVGKENQDNNLIVISRQHPPEVTGYLAMKAFVETINEDSKLAKKFRKKYTTYVFPLMNPDGVDNGHWRHNVGGVDLNRDWAAFHHPETLAVRDFMKTITANPKHKFYFGIDFHSTWDDIYYTVPSEQEGNFPGLVPNWLEAIKEAFPGYDPNVRPTNRLEPTLVSRNYFFVEHGAEALVYEVGDNTPRDFVEAKGKVAARALMELLLEK